VEKPLLDLIPQIFKVVNYALVNKNAIDLSIDTTINRFRPRTSQQTIRNFHPVRLAFAFLKTMNFHLEKYHQNQLKKKNKNHP
jgi:hypothetical protein